MGNKPHIPASSATGLGASQISQREKLDLLQEYDKTFADICSLKDLLGRAKTQKLYVERIEMINHLEKRLRLIEALGNAPDQ